MGSPTVSSAKPVPMENTDKKSLKALFKYLFPKKKEKPKNNKHIQIQNDVKQEVKPKPDPVAAILVNLNKLDLKEKKVEIIETKSNDENDELENFSFKVIEEHRNDRINSQSSDSGYSERSENSESADKTENLDNSDNLDNTVNDDKVDELADVLDDLVVFDKKKTAKQPDSSKLQTVVVSRAPIKTKLTNYVPNASPYNKRAADPFRQISQINKNTLTGGNVIVNGAEAATTDNLSVIDIACETVQQTSHYHQKDPDNYLNDLLEYISEDLINQNNQNGGPSSPYLPGNAKRTPDYPLEDLESKVIEHDEIVQLLRDNYQVPQSEIINNIQDDYFQFNTTEFSMPNDAMLSAYPTPPRSETVPSPLSASSTSFYPTNSEYFLSPERSPISNSDYELYQNIPHFEEEKDGIDKRSPSISSMTMKQYKDKQKEIANRFSKKECCQLSRRTCKELFEEHLKKIDKDERKNLCLKVANLDVKSAYRVLHHILLSLSKGSNQEDLELSLFSLICERILGEDVQIFTGESGLNLLMAAALRCREKPLLTRYLVQCIRTTIKSNPSLAADKDYVFHEVDDLGDTLVIACARAGDVCSDALSEIVRTCEDQPPLFKIHHNNADGYTALHVACSQHSAASPRIHTIHVLLEHAGFQVTDGDLKGRDTALHLAVNSINCDLELILLMFKQADRKEWKSLAHWPNLSNKTPIDLARAATKATSRQNYPKEVLEFLKKCR